MARGILSLAMLAALLCSGAGCAITDYAPWPAHKTQGEAKLVTYEIAFTGFDPQLDGTYAYSVAYDHSNIPLGAFPSITITSYHNNGGMVTAYNSDGSVKSSLPAAFNPDGMADRLGHLTGEFGSYNAYSPPFNTRDQAWGKYFISVDNTDSDCQFWDNITQDLSGSALGPATALCFGAPQEETGDLVELENFASLDQLLGSIWAGTLGREFSVNLTGVTFNGVEHAMTNPLKLAIKSVALRPTGFAINFKTPGGKELLQSILNSTVDRAGNRVSLKFSGGLKLALPSTWQVAFNHAAIRKALGQ